MTIYERLVKLIYLPKQNRLAVQIGCHVLFHYIPSQFLGGLVRCEMTKTWKKAGLEIVKGQNHFTMGIVEGDGRSSRFNPRSNVYQSWLGCYSVRLASNKIWTVEDYCRLAIADQNSWLRWYGDPNPFTSIKGWSYREVGKLEVTGGHVGNLYEGGFSSHSDVGSNLNTLRFRFASESLSALFNLANPYLRITSKAFTPSSLDFPYHSIRGRVYLCVFDISPNVKVILYSNGIIRSLDRLDTFELLKSEFLNTMKS